MWSSSPDFVTGQRFDGPDKGGVVQLAMAKPGAGVEKLLRLRGRWQSHCRVALNSDHPQSVWQNYPEILQLGEKIGKRPVDTAAYAA